MPTVKCSIHGEQEETFVCQHIVQSLEENTPYGFWWASDSNQARPDAWCTYCNELLAKAGGEWTDEILAITQVKLLCAICYDHAKAMNLSRA